MDTTTAVRSPKRTPRRAFPTPPPPVRLSAPSVAVNVGPGAGLSSRSEPGLNTGASGWLPPISLLDVPSPRGERGGGPKAFKVTQDLHEYATAHVDTWPLAGHNHSEQASTSHANGLPSPLSPRIRKVHARQRLLDDSKSQPLLLQELQTFLHDELAMLAQQQQQQSTRREGTTVEDNDPNAGGKPTVATPPRLTRLHVFRQLFQRVIDGFTVYAPLLAKIKHAYDTTVDALLDETQLLPQLRSELQSLQTQCLLELSQHQLRAKQSHAEMQHTLKDTQGRLAAAAAELSRLTKENASLRSTLQLVETRNTEMQNSNATLVNGLKRHDETLRHIHERSREEGVVLQQMANKYHRACEEIAELKKTISALEEKVGGVHVAADKATIALLTRELQELHHHHQDLVRSVAASGSMAPLALVDDRQDGSHGSSDTSLRMAAISPPQVLHHILLRVLKAHGISTTLSELLEALDPTRSRGTSGTAQTGGSQPAMALSKSRSQVRFSEPLSQASGPGGLNVLSGPQTARVEDGGLGGLGSAPVHASIDLSFALERLTTSLTERIRVHHEQVLQLQHLTTQRDVSAARTFLTTGPVGAGTVSTEPAECSRPEPREITAFTSATTTVLTPLLATNDFFQGLGLTAAPPIRSSSPGNNQSQRRALLAWFVDGHVPEFLRFDGVLRDRHYARQHVETVISKIWHQKDEMDKVKRSHALLATGSSLVAASQTGINSGLSSATGTSSSLSSHAHVPLAKVFWLHLQRASMGDHQEAVESAYNLVAALDRFSRLSADCRLFLLVLGGQLPAEARADQSRELLLVHDALAALHREQQQLRLVTASSSSSSSSSSQYEVSSEATTAKIRSEAPGLTLAEAVRALRQLFTWKTDMQLDQLHRAMLLDQRGNPQASVEYAMLLQPSAPAHAETSRGGSRIRGMGRALSATASGSHFAEALRVQYLEDVVQYREYLQQQVRQLLRQPSSAEPDATTTAVAVNEGEPGASHMVAIRALRDCLQRSDVAKPVQEINLWLVRATGLSMDQILTQDAVMLDAHRFIATLPSLLVKPSGKFPRPGDRRGSDNSAGTNQSVGGGGAGRDLLRSSGERASTSASE